MNIKAKELPPSDLEPPPDIFEEELENPAFEPSVDTNFTGDNLLPEPDEKKPTTMKLIVWICLLNGIAWVWCSYILAALGKEQIAESLSQVALTEIIGVVLVYAVKSVFENLSKNNSWPDKPGSDPPAG